MKSLQVRILCMLIACVILCAVVLSEWVNIEFRNHGPQMFHHDSLRFMANHLEQLWSQPDHQQFDDFIAKMNLEMRTEFQWLDENGNDLRGGINRPEVKEKTSANTRKDRRHSNFGPGRRHLFLPPIEDSNDRLGFINVTSSGNFLLVQWVKIRPPGLPPMLFLSIVSVLLLFGLLMSNYVARPVHQLKLTLEEFGKGNLAVRSGIRRADEIGDLVRAFNAMADQVATDIERERGMVRSISHEVRSPLTRMRLLLERIRKQKDTANSISRLESEIQTLGRIPDLLIQMADIEQGRAHLEMQNVGISEFLDFYVHRLEPVASAKSCKIMMELKEISDLESIRTDPEILGRCLENILENAIRFAPESTAIEMHCHKTDRQIVFQFRDYGSGVPDAELEKIFEPFFRSDASRNRHSGGLGLGLAITKSAVKALGGEISARNAQPGLLIEITMPIENAG